MEDPQARAIEVTATHWICLSALLLCAGCARPDHRPIDVGDDTHKALGPDEVTPIETCLSGAGDASRKGCGS